MSVLLARVCSTCKGQKFNLRYPRPGRCWNLNLGPLKGQQLLLATPLPFHPIKGVLIELLNQQWGGFKISKKYPCCHGAYPRQTELEVRVNIISIRTGEWLILCIHLSGPPSTGPGLSVWLLLNETFIEISRLGKADCPPNGPWSINKTHE